MLARAASGSVGNGTSLRKFTRADGNVQCEQSRGRDREMTEKELFMVSVSLRSASVNDASGPAASGAEDLRLADLFLELGGLRFDFRLVGRQLDPAASLSFASMDGQRRIGGR